jgi:hypothetical protein
MIPRKVGKDTCAQGYLLGYDVHITRKGMKFSNRSAQKPLSIGNIKLVILRRPKPPPFIFVPSIANY